MFVWTAMQNAEFIQYDIFKTAIIPNLSTAGDSAASRSSSESILWKRLKGFSWRITDKFKLERLLFVDAFCFNSGLEIDR